MLGPRGIGSTHLRLEDHASHDDCCRQGTLSTERDDPTAGLVGISTCLVRIIGVLIASGLTRIDGRRIDEGFIELVRRGDPVG
jgi:hypothetical protein